MRMLAPLIGIQLTALETRFLWLLYRIYTRITHKVLKRSVCLEHINLFSLQHPSRHRHSPCTVKPIHKDPLTSYAYGYNDIAAGLV
jgi:hypothetical protein